MSDQEDNTKLPGHLGPMLDALRDDRRRAGYYLSLLAPLHKYDSEHHGDLVKTLTAYLRHAGNSSRTADALYLHRNSLRYRLARIRALTGLDIAEPDTRLALQVAVLLEAGEPGQNDT